MRAVRFILLISLLAAGVMTLGGWLDRRGGVRRAGDPAGNGDVVALVFGEARKVVSRELFDRAELYFHGGVADAAAECAEHGHGGALAAAAASPAQSHAEHHDEEQAADGGARKWDLWSRLNRGVHPSEHRHLSGVREEKEIIPWIWAAAAADPHNTAAYSVGAYWLSRRLGKIDEGLRFIEEGIRRNPQSCELEFCRGDVLLQTEPARPGVAREAFQAALRKWMPEQFEDADDGRLFRRNALIYVGTLSRMAGDRAAARACFGEVLEMFPGQATATRHLREMDAEEAGRTGVP
jgi:tetratricopeptide (TPR) repeat protein